MIEMQTADIIEVVKNVLTSWQVIAVTIAILLFISIVNYVSRGYQRPRVKKAPKAKKVKEAPAAAPLGGEGDDLPAGNSNDELGLEEA